MTYLCAASILCYTLISGGPVSAKDACTHTWDKAHYKTFKQVQGEIQDRLIDGKILRLSLCGAENNHYFQVTILQISGKVQVIRVPAH